MPAEDPLQSPCRARCKLNEDKICIGCLRSEAEIVNWGNASDDRKRAILARLAALKNGDDRSPR